MTDTPEGTGPLTVDSAVARLLATPEPDSAPAKAAPEETASHDSDEEAEGVEPEAVEAEAEPGSDEPEEEEAADQDEAGDDTEEDFTIEIDGKKLTKDEVRKGYLRQSDYTRKTQELAEQRKAVEAETSQARALRQQYAQGLELLAANLPKLQEPDRNLLDSDPVEYLRQEREFREAVSRSQAIRAEQMRVATEHKAEMERSRNTRLAKESELLRAAFPGWKTPEDAQKEIGAIRSFAKDAYSFSDEDLAGLVDHRAVLVLRDAMQWRRAEQAKVKAKEKTANLPEVTMKAGTRPSKGSEQKRVADSLRQKVKRTGRMDDAVKYLLGR